MRINFFWIGNTQNPNYSRLEREYLERIGRFVSCKCTTIPELKKSDSRKVASQLEKEGRLIRKKLNKTGFLIVLDQSGEQPNSEFLAKKLSSFMNSGVPEVTFLVGGHIGIPESVLEEANWKLSLSKLTLPHEMARVVLLEQLYRAFSILRGLPYHR